MPTQPSRTLRVRWLLDFLGPKVSWLMLAGLGLGLGLFAVEIAFAYTLQAFLVGIGVMSLSNCHIPTWLPHSSLAVVFGFIALLGVLRGLLFLGQTYCQGVALEELKYLQRARILKWALHSESASSSEVTTLFNARTDATGSSVYSLQSLTVQVTSAALLAFSLLVMAPLVTALAGLILLALLWPLRWLDRTLKDAAEFMVGQWDKTHRRLLVGIKNLLLLQIYGTQSQEEALAQKSLLAYRNRVSFFYWIQGLKYVAPQILGLLLVCLIAWTAKKSLHMSAGVLISYFYLFLRLIQALATVSQSVSSLAFSWPQVVIMNDWWHAHSHDAPSRRGARRSTGEDAPVRLEEGALIGWRLRRMSFRYPDAAAPVLSNLDLRIEPGTALVVIGQSGSGKSTLLNLLLGGLRPSGGTVEAISANGGVHPLTAIRSQLLRTVGYVGPETFLIEGTIHDNLLYGLHEVPTRDEIHEALRMSECHFVADIPEGLNHSLTEQGQGLSAGQKQRLALARALLRKPRVLILDEATSNLDSETEAKLVETFAQFKGRMTLIAATHRQALLRIADQRLVLKVPEG